MMQGFWGGDISIAVNQQARVAAVVAAVHAAAAPGTFRIVGITRLGAESRWRAAGRLEALGMELEREKQRH
jgi:hypothetical protein